MLLGSTHSKWAGNGMGTRQEEDIGCRGTVVCGAGMEEVAWCPDVLVGGIAVSIAWQRKVIL